MGHTQPPSLEDALIAVRGLLIDTAAKDEHNQGPERRKPGRRRAGHRPVGRSKKGVERRASCEMSAGPLVLRWNTGGFERPHKRQVTMS